MVENVGCDFSVLEETDSLKIYHRNNSNHEDCGAAFDPKLERFDLANFEVTTETRQLLVAIYLVVSLLGAILVAFRGVAPGAARGHLPSQYFQIVT